MLSKKGMDKMRLIYTGSIYIFSVLENEDMNNNKYKQNLAFIQKLFSEFTRIR